MKRVKWIGLLILAAGLLCFGVLEGIILAGGRDDVTQEAPVMIVLGCMVYPDGPSPALQSRMDKALEYWRAHPETELILSGGQGADEVVSEAQAMADYFRANGVPAERIHLEDTSTSTRENLQNSMAVMEALGYDPAQTPVIVVSNGFHLARIRMLCARYGLSADTLSAPMPTLPSAVKSYIREVFALVKSFLLD